MKYLYNTYNLPDHMNNVNYVIDCTPFLRYLSVIIILFNLFVMYSTFLYNTTRDQNKDIIGSKDQYVPYKKVTVLRT